MKITISQIEAELQTELLTCSECHIRTRTLPAENVAAQALRYGILCGHVFYMELPPPPHCNWCSTYAFDC